MRLLNGSPGLEMVNWGVLDDWLRVTAPLSARELLRDPSQDLFR